MIPLKSFQNFRIHAHQPQRDLRNDSMVKALFVVENKGAYGLD